MNWESLKARFKGAGPARSMGFVLPAVALEIQPDFVAGAHLDGSSREVRRLSVRQLEAGTLEPGAGRANITNEAALREAVSDVAEVVGNGGGRLGLLVPDGVTRVGLLSFETLPESHAEAEALVRWKMRDLLPFGPDEARVSFQVLRREGKAVELLAVAARNAVLAEYEGILEAVDGGPALILPATLALLPLLPEDPGACQLLIHVCSGSITSVVVLGQRVVFWRSRPGARPAPEELAAEVGREAARVKATSRDHQGMEISAAWLCARPGAPEGLSEGLARTLEMQVPLLTGTRQCAPQLPPAEHEWFERVGAPFAGLVANAG